MEDQERSRDSTRSSRSKSNSVTEMFMAEDECSNSSSNLDDSGNVTKQLQMLKFANPGKFMDNFDPERSAREMRKMNRRIYRESTKKNQMFGETGVLIENGQDLCDCLDVCCLGCHFPCSKCGSEKCGTDCRCGRKWFYEHVEVEGTSLILKWPFSASTNTGASTNNGTSSNSNTS